MEIDLFCVEPDSKLVPRIQENCARYPLRVRQEAAHDGHAVLVGGGPSLRDRISSIKQRQEHGQTVFALNGAAGFLNANGIIPDYQVLLDPQELLKDYFRPAGGYLIASQCHPAVLAASPKPPILWHVATEGREETTPLHPDGDCLVGGGYTVGLCSMCLVYALGYRQLHLYGYDSSVTEQGDHAYPCPVPGVQQVFDADPCVVVTIAGRKFRTTFSLAKQAQTFPKVCDDLIDAGCTVTVDCDGLLKAIVDESNRLNAAQAA
jgi:hypothetical protein